MLSAHLAAAKHVVAGRRLGAPAALLLLAGACSRGPGPGPAAPTPEEIVALLQEAGMGPVRPPPSAEDASPDLFVVLVKPDLVGRWVRGAGPPQLSELTASEVVASLRVRPDGAIAAEPLSVWFEDGGASGTLARTVWVAIDEYTAQQTLLTAVTFEAAIDFHARIRAARADGGWRVISFDVRGGE